MVVMDRHGSIGSHEWIGISIHGQHFLNRSITLYLTTTRFWPSVVSTVPVRATEVRYTACQRWGLRNNFLPAAIYRSTVSHKLSLTIGLWRGWRAVIRLQTVDDATTNWLTGNSVLSKIFFNHKNILLLRNSADPLGALYNWPNLVQKHAWIGDHRPKSEGMPLYSTTLQIYII